MLVTPYRLAGGVSTDLYIKYKSNSPTGQDGSVGEFFLPSITAMSFIHRLRYSLSELPVIERRLSLAAGPPYGTLSAVRGSLAQR